MINHSTIWQIHQFLVNHAGDLKINNFLSLLINISKSLFMLRYQKFFTIYLSHAELKLKLIQVTVQMFLYLTNK